MFRVILWGRYIGDVIERGYAVVPYSGGARAVSRYLVRWRHPEDGEQRTWVDKKEVRPW